MPKLQPQRLNVGSPWRSGMKLMAKLFITHGHQHIEVNDACTVHRQELLANLQTPPGIASKQSDTIRLPAHIQTPPANNHEEVPQSILKAPGIIRNYSASSSKHLGSNGRPQSYTLQPLQDLPMWTLLLG